MNTKRYTIQPRKQIFVISDLLEVIKFKDLFQILAGRDIKLRYKQTILGVGWVLFQPLITTLIFTMLFSRFAPLADNSLPYPIFAYLGLIFWTYFSNSLNALSGALLSSEAILKKVYFPRLIALLSVQAAHILDFFIGSILLIIFLITYRVMLTPLFLAVYLFSFVIITLTVIGLGMLTSALNVKYRDVRYALPFIIQIMIFLTPVFYPLTIVSPERRLYLAINPLTTVIESTRASLTSSQLAGHNFWAISLMTTFFTLVIGYWYFKKTENYFADIL